jgi:hypothetical protein
MQITTPEVKIARFSVHYIAPNSIRIQQQPISVAFTIHLDETTLGALDRRAEETERSCN